MVTAILTEVQDFQLPICQAIQILAIASGRHGIQPSMESGLLPGPESLASRSGWVALPTWRFLVLVEIANFATLRRVLGRGRTQVLSVQLAQQIGATVGAVSSQVAGRTLIELEMSGNAPEELDARLAEIEAAFAAPIDIDGERHAVELVVAGAASQAAWSIEDVQLVEQAERALAQAREERRRIIGETDRDALTGDEANLRRELAAAIANDEIFLQYQPKLHLRRQEVASAEALVRWRHPKRGVVFPGDFIPVAEKSGLIDALTLWTLGRVIEDQLTLRAEAYDFPLFINVSGQLLSNPEFIQTACAMIAGSGARIGFEITETATIDDPQSAIAHLHLVAEHGVPIAIDDYGAGLSSLAYLKQLPATELKIDKMFVMELTSSHRDPLIVRSTIDLAHAMEMEVTAEGVETPAALALLSVMGCDLVQGFLLSRPLSLPAFTHYLRTEANQAFAQGNYSFNRHKRLLGS